MGCLDTRGARFGGRLQVTNPFQKAKLSGTCFFFERVLCPQDKARNGPRTVDFLQVAVKA